MAVYTALEEHHIKALLAQYDLGHMIEARGISEGIENSNYLLSIAGLSDATTSEYVLTIAENQNLRDVECIAKLLVQLKSKDLPVAAPILTTQGEAVVLIQGKAAVLVPKISGQHPEIPTLGQCRQIGTALGRIHRTTLAIGSQHSGHRSLAWMVATAESIRERLIPAERKLLGRALAALARITSTHDLPQAVIHGDLFRDNTLFQGDQLNAVIDFFSAGTGYLLFDLAIVANDWCMGDNNRLDVTRLENLLEGYAAKRPPTPAERRLWPAFLQIAALRFWVSRLAEQHSRKPDTALLSATEGGKNPDQYKAILARHNANPALWPL